MVQPSDQGGGEGGVALIKFKKWASSFIYANYHWTNAIKIIKGNVRKEKEILIFGEMLLARIDGLLSCIPMGDLEERGWFMGAGEMINKRIQGWLLRM